MRAICVYLAIFAFIGTAVSSEELEHFGLELHEHEGMRYHLPKAAVCDSCKAVLSSLDSYLKSNSALTHEVVQHAESEICAILPSEEKEMCDYGVAQFAPALVKYAEDKVLDPKNACPELGMCSANMYREKVVYMPRENNLANSLRCDICEKVVGWADSILRSKSVDSYAVTELENICHYLPKNIQPQCNSAVQQAVPNILAFIGQELEQRACQAERMK